MSTPTPNDYPTLLAHARIAALQALTDILATSKDPTERHRAAAAILRAPSPRPVPQPMTPTPAPSPTPIAHPASRGPHLRVASHDPHSDAITVDLTDDLEDLDDLLNIDLPQLLPIYRGSHRRSRTTRLATAAGGEGGCPSDETS